jgi:glycerophosphoryl diester phosphodiesterase
MLSDKKCSISRIVLVGMMFLTVLCCKEKNNKSNYKKDKTNFKGKRISNLINQLNNSIDDKIMVVAHRGDWRNAPENSLQAIQNCIDMGVDMVEIDVRKTKDNQLIVIHDETLDRTTTGKGLVANWNLDSLKTLYLKNGANHTTHHKIPTLKEALEVSKGEILINLDKCYGYFNETFKIIQETNTAKQVVIKGYNKTIEDVKADFGSRLDSIIFMPIVNLDKQPNAFNIIQDFQDNLRPLAFEVVFSKDTSKVLSKFDKIKNNERGSRIWVNTLWETLNAGYEDDMAIKNPDSIYGWHIKKGANMLQTDRPQLLLQYLRSKGLHD